MIVRGNPYSDHLTSYMQRVRDNRLIRLRRENVTVAISILQIHSDSDTQYDFFVAPISAYDLRCVAVCLRSAACACAPQIVAHHVPIDFCRLSP